MMTRFMQEALALARQAEAAGEIPVGCVIEKDGVIVGRGRNRRETDRTALGHAEIEAIAEACRTLGEWRLSGCRLFVTLEPCSMCAGAMVWARISNLYIGAMDPKAGACGSVFQIPTCTRLNHNIHVETGIMEEECSAMMRRFFVQLRNRKNQSKAEE